MTQLMMRLTPMMFALALAGCDAKTAAESAATAPREHAAVDSVTGLPDNYKLEFENDYAKVVRVHYPVGAKLPEHIHPGGMTAYIYLNDNEGVIFDHLGGGDRPLRRPPVKAGGVRFQTSAQEHHTLENPSPTPSDFIRVWYKTDQADLKDKPVIRRRMAVSDAEYSNTATRITRPSYEAGQAFAAPASDFPSLVVAWPSGQHRWFDAKAQVSIPASAGTQGFVRIEFLTPPAKLTRTDSRQ